MNIFLTGASSGVGQACHNLFKDQHNIVAPSSLDFDLADFENIANTDLSDIDCVINCAGLNHGSYLGWLNNSWANQQNQVDVNFTGPLMLAKQYVKKRKHGQFIFVTSANIADPIAHNIFYTAAKMALKYSLDTIKLEFPDIVFTEICPGKIQTNMLFQNYQGTKTKQEIKQIYAQTPCLTPEEIAQHIEYAIKYKIDCITVNPT